MPPAPMAAARPPGLAAAAANGCMSSAQLRICADAQTPTAVASRGNTNNINLPSAIRYPGAAQSPSLL
jgi:hypothetical protein